MAEPDPLSLRLPLTKVRNLVRLDPDITLANHEAIFLVAKATEIFIDTLAKKSAEKTTKEKRKLISRADVNSAIEDEDNLNFLQNGVLDMTSDKIFNGTFQKEDS